MKLFSREITTYRNFIYLIMYLQKADFVAADLTMTASRDEDVDFTPPFLSAELTVLTKAVSS